jgi:uncharacterized protein (UPF0305 family)
MFKELSNLKSKKIILKNDLMEILHDIAKSISINDIMFATTMLREDGKYIQAKYREEYLEIYLKYFIIRVSDVKKDKKNYNEKIDNENNFKEAIELLKNQFEENKANHHELGKFPEIYSIIGLYTTFILNEPIHPIGTPFPGSLKVTYENGTYYCPVKDKQSETPQAVCRFCIAKQSDL